MDNDRPIIELQRVKKGDGKKVWVCGVPGCVEKYSHESAEAMELHLGEEHTTRCLVSDILWLNTRGEDVIPEECSSASSRQISKHDGTRVWVRVSTAVSIPLWVF